MSLRDVVRQGAWVAPDGRLVEWRLEVTPLSPVVGPEIVVGVGGPGRFRGLPGVVEPVGFDVEQWLQDNVLVHRWRLESDSFDEVEAETPVVDLEAWILDALGEAGS